jgi:MFS family permease
MLVQAGALALVASSTSYGPWIVAVVLLALGTVIVYPTLLAAIGDVAHPIWRARAVGVDRLWRDAGFAAGALLAGLIADQWGLTSAVWVVAALTAGSGLVVAARMYETRSVQAPAADRRVNIHRLDGRWQPLRRRFPGTRDRWSRAHTTLDL